MLLETTWLFSTLLHIIEKNRFSLKEGPYISFLTEGKKMFFPLTFYCFGYMQIWEVVCFHCLAFLSSKIENLAFPKIEIFSVSKSLWKIQLVYFYINNALFLNVIGVSQDSCTRSTTQNRLSFLFTFFTAPCNP